MGQYNLRLAFCIVNCVYISNCTVKMYYIACVSVHVIVSVLSFISTSCTRVIMDVFRIVAIGANLYKYMAKLGKFSYCDSGF